jgi:tRNA (guanine-N7-)-methyltransferase
MRLKHIKDAEIKIYDSEYVIKNPFEYKGNWKNVFKNDNPIRLEIGMGKGDFIISLALANPNINYIGIEKYASVLLICTNKLKTMDKLNNLKLIVMDAMNINEIFDKEIERLYLNFSDPWPKNRHKNRRLSSSVFLEKYDNIFLKDKIIELKTDNDNLFEFSLESFKEYGYIIDEINYNYNALYKTEYEKKFILKNVNIKYVKVHKN